MSKKMLAINPTTEGTGTHDPSATIFEDGSILYGIEEERLNRKKHSFETFPKQSIRSCLDFCELQLPDLDRILISWEPKKMSRYNIRLAFDKPNLRQMLYYTVKNIKNYSISLSKIKSNLAEFGTPVPPIETYNHHRCHAASAFYPSDFEEALVVTLDGRGESDSTVVWRGNTQGLERIKSYDFPNSLGGFYGAITSYLGYRINNDEGKVMGLAPYGNTNKEIETKFRNLIRTDENYDVGLGFHNGQAIPTLESVFNKAQKSEPKDFSQWEKDFAYEGQDALETIVENIVETYCHNQDLSKVCLAGGVALNCKMNKRIMELSVVDDIFIQPVSHDAGTAIGAGMVANDNNEINDDFTVYLGPQYTSAEIKETLEEYKLDFTEPDQLEQWTAKRLADGELVGWFQGRLEMGPRALGNRSILADPRTADSRDQVNQFVKHREEWRPFAPSLLEEAADEYLINAEPAPYMIKTFDVKDEKKDEIPAVLHPGDDTTRPQTVRKEQNPRYYKLLKQFERITDVPVLLNTSFNDSGEPIVNTPSEAIKDFFGMGLDTLVMEDIVLQKTDER